MFNDKLNFDEICLKLNEYLDKIQHNSEIEDLK